MRRFLSLMLLCAAGSLPGVALAQDVMYARSNGDWLEDSKPGQYSALNILDDDKSTVWCSRGSGKDAEITVVFSDQAMIERIKVATGNQASKKSFSEFNRVRKLEIMEGDMMHTVSLEDKSGFQTLRFDPTLATDRLTLRLKEGFRGKSKRHACLTDVVFYKGNKPLNGKYLKPHIRKHAKAMEFIDTWISGPEFARDRELAFGINGSYRFVYVPNDPLEKRQLKTGNWRAKGDSPEVKYQESWVPIQALRDDAGRLEKLKIAEGLMEGTYIRLRGKPAY